MTDSETELYELCREVYERFPTWTDTLQCVWNGQISMPDQSVIDFGIESKYEGYCPLYTSDYLLDKLPSVVQDSFDKKFRHIQMWVNGDKTSHAGYVEPYAHDDKVAYAQESGEMLATLLKLTLALHEEKLLA